jgi:hypothetical protein
VRELADGVGRYASLAFGVLEGVGLDLGLVGLEVDGRAPDELAVFQAGGDDLACDRVGQGDVAADVEPEPEVGPLRRRRAARIDRDQSGAVPDAAQQVVEEDRVRLPGVAAPEDDQIGLLSLAV